MLILDSSQLNAQVETSEQLPQCNIRGQPGTNTVPVSLHPNALPLCQVSLCILNSSKHHVPTHSYINVTKVLLYCFLLACSECRLRRFRLFYKASNCLDAGTSHSADKNRTIQPFFRWLSCSTGHSLCTPTNLFDGN